MEENGIAISFDINKIHENIFKRLFRKLGIFIQNAITRVFEIVVSLIGLIFLIPLTILVFFQNIKNGDNGPVFYTQKRIGKNGKLFKMYKFRTMVNNADEILAEMLQDREISKEYEKYRKLRNDPRLTKFGKVLRAKSLDEFPQFINVLKGEMSIVGPRPYITAQTSNSKTASINVTVKPIEVTEVKISSENIQLEEGETANISANVFPENATDKTIEWSVENPEVATIEDEIITAVSSGTTKLFCISKDGVKAETTITVKSDEKEVEDVVTEKEENDNNTSTQVRNTNTPLANAAVGISFLEIILLIICGIKLRSKEEKFNIKKFIGNVVSWILTIFALIFAIASTSVISLILALASSISIAPPICKLLNSKLEGKYTVKIRIITYFVLLIISLILI